MQNRPLTSHPSIIFYDGQCPLCNRCVRWLAKLDRKSKLKFASLQGKTAKRLLSDSQTKSNSVIYFESGKIFERSQAVIGALITTGGIGKLAYPLLWLPQRWLDFLYNQIAKNRHRFFARRDACPIEQTFKISVRFLE